MLSRYIGIGKCIIDTDGDDESTCTQIDTSGNRSGFNLSNGGFSSLIVPTTGAAMYMAVVRCCQPLPNNTFSFTRMYAHERGRDTLVKFRRGFDGPNKPLGTRGDNAPRTPHKFRSCHAVSL